MPCETKIDRRGFLRSVAMTGAAVAMKRQGAKEFDFAVITHNHLDHYTQKFYNEMNSRLHKTVVSNFMDNYGAVFHKGVGGFARGERTFRIKDVVVRTYQSDHNEFLRGFTMPAEIECGDYTIFHVGDTSCQAASRGQEGCHIRYRRYVWLYGWLVA